MDLSGLVGIVKSINIIVGVIAALIGVDLLLGAKFTILLKKFLDKTIVVCDHMMLKIGGFVRKTLDKQLEFDDKILKSRGRTIMGVLLILFAALLIGLSRRM